MNTTNTTTAFPQLAQVKPDPKSELLEIAGTAWVPFQHPIAALA